MTDVTIVIPCYNNSATIEAAVRSARAQSVPVNIIVVDDGSTDDTFEKLQRLEATDPKLRVLVQPYNQGPSAARNRAISLAETPWIAILDADDYMHPNRISRMLQVGNLENLDFVADDLIRVDNEHNPKTGTRLWSDNHIGLLKIDLARFARENIDKYSGSRRELGYLKPMMRASFLKTHGLSYNDSMRLAEDYDLYSRALAAGASFGLIDPCGYFSVDYPNSLSKSYPAFELKNVADRVAELIGDSALSKSERAALRELRAFWQKNYAWMQLIEAKRRKDLIGILAVLLAPPAVSAAVLLRSIKHALGVTPVKPRMHRPAKAQSINTLLSS